jgi:flagellar assembly factor FliW
MTEKTNILSDTDSSKEVIFPRGIPGLEDLTRYRVLYSDTAAGRVYWMESCEAPGVIFTLVDPRRYALNYVLELTDEEQSLLQADSPEDIVVLLMLWKPDPADQTARPGLHANIAGPILINVEKRIGMQKTLASSRLELSISSQAS